MMNGIVIRYVCLLILSLLLQTWNYLIRLSQELPLVSVLPRRFTDVGELIPIANATQNGLLSKQTAPSTLYIRNKTYIELHHSLPADWNTFMFLLMISGTGIADGDAVLIIHGSNESNSEGRCTAKSLYGNLSKKLQLKWEQKPDKSIHIYLVEAEGGKMGGYRLFKQHCCLENENTDIIVLDTLDISALKDLVIS